MIKSDSQYLSGEDDYKLTEKKPEDIEEKYDIPQYMEQMELSADQKERLLSEIKKEFEAIKEERESEGLERKWRMLQNQYEGVMEEDELRQFNLSRKITKIKCDHVERMIMKAAWKTEQKFSITARPQFAKEGGQEVVEAQSDYLDYKFDNDIPFLEPQRKTVHTAVVKGTGIQKWVYKLSREKRKRDETYDGSKTEPMQGPQGQLIERNIGLEQFLKAYPDAMKSHAGIVKKLMAGKKVTLEVEYEETTYNDPWASNVKLEDFYVRLCTDGYEGLKTTKLIVERQEYNYWDLRRLEKQKEFYGIDDLVYEKGADGVRKGKENFETKKYKILECTFYFKLKESDDEEVKIVTHVAEEEWMCIGHRYYPYYAVPCIYNPHHIAKIWEGFYQPGLAEYVTDNNIAENAILNFMLEGVMTANTITPIVDSDNPAFGQFLEKRWAHGIPIETTGGKPIDFLQKYIGNFNHQSLLTMLEFLGREDGDITGVNQVQTGRESQLDPNAPAAKTAMLIQQSGLNIEDYVDCMIPSFNRTAEIVLQLIAQHNEEGGKYAPRPEKVVGSNPFSVISRQDMIARTNIQSQAKAFNFDEMNQKAELLSLWQMLRPEPLFNQNPNAVYSFLKMVVKSWSKQAKNMIDQILPSLEEFNQQKKQLAVQGTVGFLQQQAQQAALGGQQEIQAEPPAIAQQLMQVIGVLLKESATPPSEQEMKAREQQAKQNGVPQNA
jgi:hypothetical protein